MVCVKATSGMQENDMRFARIFEVTKQKAAVNVTVNVTGCFFKYTCVHEQVDGTGHSGLL